MRPYSAAWISAFCNRYPVAAAGSALELDAIDNLFAVHSLKQVLTSYSGNMARIRNVSETDANFGPDGSGWIDAAAIATHIGGSSGRIMEVYDHTGSGISATAQTPTLAPLINLSGAHPTMDFAGGKRLEILGALGFARLAGARSLIAVGKADATTTTAKYLLFVSRGATNAARAIIGNVTTAAHRAGGRREDADSFAAVTGFTADTSWHVHIARFDWTNAALHYRRDTETETLDPFHDVGSTSDTDSLNVLYGANAAGTDTFEGEATMFALVSDLLTAGEESALATSLAGMKL